MSSLPALRGEAGGPVGIAMTAASFDQAQRAGVELLEPNLDAMAEIAHFIGFTPPDERLQPLLLVTRSSEASRAFIGRWDDRLPVDQASPQTGRFNLAADITSQQPRSAHRDNLAKIAAQVGAKNLTEISVADWGQKTREHVGAFATGLLLGQRPLELPPPPSLATGLFRAVGDALSGDPQKSRLIEAAKNHPSLGNPFRVVFGGNSAERQ